MLCRRRRGERSPEEPPRGRVRAGIPRSRRSRRRRLLGEEVVAGAGAVEREEGRLLDIFQLPLLVRPISGRVPALAIGRGCRVGAVTAPDGVVSRVLRSMGLGGQEIRGGRARSRRAQTHLRWQTSPRKTSRRVLICHQSIRVSSQNFEFEFEAETTPRK